MYEIKWNKIKNWTEVKCRKNYRKNGIKILFEKGSRINFSHRCDLYKDKKS